MSAIGTWDKISGALGSTNSTFGGEWGNLLSDLLNGIDVGLADPTKAPIINTNIRFRYGKLKMFDADDSHTVRFSVDDIDTGVDRNIRIRRMNSPNEEDFMVLENLPQAIKSKDIDSDLNNITNIVNSDIKAAAGIVYSKLSLGNSILASDLTTDSVTTIKIQDNAITQPKMADNSVGTAEIIDLNVTLGKLAADSVDSSKIVNDSIVNADINSAAAILTTKLADSSNFVLINRANTYGSFLQTFITGFLRIQNASNYVALASAVQSGNFNASIPVLAANDTFAMLGVSNTFTVAPKVNVSASAALTLYRPQNVASNGVGVIFNQQNSTPAEVTYSAIYGIVSTNTAGAEDGAISFQTRKAGVFGEKMSINKDGILAFGDTNKVTISAAALTQARALTLADAAGRIVLNSFDNGFTSLQTITHNINNQFLNLYRTANTVGNDLGIQFRQQDSASNVTTYGEIRGRIGVNTDLNETGYLDFYTMKAGTLGQYMVLDGNQLSLGLSGVRAVLDASGISSSSKTLTLPNSTGVLQNENIAATFINKSISGSTNTFTNIPNSALVAITDKTKLPTDTMFENTVQNEAFSRVYGEFIPTNKNGNNRGSGPFDHLEIISSGVLSPSIDYTGDLMYYTTTAAVGSQSGLISIAREFTQRAKNFFLKISFVARDGSASDKREYIGVSNRTSILPSSDTPISTTESGLLLGRRTTDNGGTYKIFYNDGAGGAAIVVDTTVTIPTSPAIYFLEITGSPSNMTWKIIDSQAPTGSLGSGTLSTQIPGNTTTLYFQAVAENRTLSSPKVIGIKKMVYRGTN